MRDVKETIRYLKDHGVGEIDIAIILGSGLNDFVEYMEDSITIKYEDIPDFPVSTVKGHAGELVYGILSGKKILALKGRFHYYEGYKMEDVTYPVYVLGALGVKHMIVTNAAGGIAEDMKPGDLMMITDHINLMGTNPLIGAHDDSLGERFPDMSDAYNKELRDHLRKVATETGITLREGVYLGFSGPSYETAAEIRMAKIIGGSAVGMSTVPEVIVASMLKIKVVGVSCITNLGTGMQSKLSHSEVIETTKQSMNDFRTLIMRYIETYESTV